jgi:heme/copper-type cytochrome/quinol oxidase subunit 4
MCFSATASFVASGALLLIGCATFAVARKKDKILVAIPILFGIQQFFEGIQWLYLNRGSTSPWAAYGFLLFALIIWPFYVPMFVMMMEKKRRKLMAAFVALGILVALYFSGLLLLEAVHVRERNACVNYAFNFPFKWTVLSLYLLATMGPLLVSSRLIFRWFGLAIAAMSVLAWWEYKVNFVSVWCFFSAGVSAMFFLYVQRRRSKRPHAD